MQQEKPTIAPAYKIYGYFLLGLSTAIAFRALIVIDHVEPAWVRPVWYFGVLGNFVFFLHRYRITERRKKVVKEFQLIEKVRSGSSLSPDERDVLVYLLNSIKLSPENINYLVIFLFSLVAIAIDIGLSFM